MADAGMSPDTNTGATPPAPVPPRRAVVGKIALVAALVPYLATGFLILYRPG